MESLYLLYCLHLSLPAYNECYQSMNNHVHSMSMAPPTERRGYAPGTKFIVCSDPKGISIRCMKVKIHMNKIDYAMT